MNPNAQTPSIFDKVDPTMIVHAAVIVVIVLVLYHFAFHH